MPKDLLFFSDLPVGAFQGLTALEVLNLENCQIQELDQSMEKVVKRLQRFGFSSNPITCDCKLRWLWILATKVEQRNKFDLPKCSTPFSVKNLALTELKGKFALGNESSQG